jgi:hypothetical protein
MYIILTIAFVICFWVLVFKNQQNIDLKDQNEMLRNKNKTKEEKEAEDKLRYEAEKKRILKEVEDTHGI